MSIARKAFLIFALPILIQLIVLGMFIRAERQSDEHRAWQTRSTERVMAAARLLGAINDAQSAARAYALGGSRTMLDDFQRSLATGRRALRDLQHLYEVSKAAAGAPAVQPPVDVAEVVAVTNRAVADLEVVSRLVAQGRGAEAALHLQGTDSIAAMDDFRRVGRAYQAEELKAQLDRHETMAEVTMKARLEALVLVATNLVTGLALLWFLMLHVRGRLRLAVQNMRRFASGETLHPAEDASDEIGQLDAQFHAMAWQLEAARQSLQEHNEELARLNEEKNHFIGMAAHDLRNPLFGVLLAVEWLLRRAELSEGMHVVLRRLQTTVRGLNHLVSDFLDISQIEAGELCLRREVHDVVAIASDAAESVQYLADQKQIVVHCEANEPAPASVDRDKIGQVVINLLTNALKFSPAGAVVRTLVTRVGGVVRVAVEDNGPGIAPAEMERLFQLFSRSSNKPTAGETSTGLGLAICRKIVEGHGGHITVTSEVGHGATFAFDLPV